MAYELTLYPEEIAELLRGPLGPVMRYMIDKTQIFQAAARHTLEPHNKTGCLSGSIVKRIEKTVTGDIQIRVQADTTPCSPSRRSYSLYVEDDTKAHDIVGNPILAFNWGGAMAFFTSVHHPGTKGVHYFRDNLRVFGL
jgi:hypothetical protein